MKITEKQRAEILPLLQKATQASIGKWEFEGAKDVDAYVDGCEEEASC